MTLPPASSDQSLPRSSPAEQGVDPAAVTAFLDAMGSAGLELHSLMVLRHGQVVAEGWWAPYRPDELHLLYSLSKSFTSTAVGLAVAEGLLDLDDRVTGFFADELPAELGPRAATLTVRHLLSMASGHREDTVERLDQAHLVSSFLSLEPEEEPGVWFTYNNGCTLLLSAIITRLTGGRLLDYLRPRLLEPLGITEAYWDGLGGLDLGFSGLHLTTDAVARLGQLYLQQGRWRGEQLLPAAWVAEATRRQVDNPREPTVDWRQGYGYQFWMARHGYRGDGAFGQFCIVLPEHDAVVAMTSATADMQAVLDRVWSELLPGLTGEPDPADDSTADSAELTRRLGSLSLPVVVGTAAGTDVPLPWTAGPEGDGVALTGLAGSPEGGWELTLAVGAVPLSLRCGSGAWSDDEVELAPGVRLRTAACGAWTGPTTFTADVAFVQTPHRLRLVRDLAGGTTGATWNEAPLGPRGIAGLAFQDARR